MARHFRKWGIVDRRIRELKSIPLSPDIDPRGEITGSFADDTFRLCCPVEFVELLSVPITMPDRVFGHKISLRFSTPTMLNKILNIAQLRRLASFHEAGNGTHTQNLSDRPYERLTPAQKRLIQRHQNRLAKKFGQWLKRRGYSSVQFEQGRVDVQFRLGKRLFKAELKVCRFSSTRRGIRDAIAQLLEYNCYGKRTLASEWFIVLDKSPSDLDLQYLRKISARYSLPLVLVWKSKNSFDEFRPR